ncbi:MAG: ABC transporter permease [Chloroflexi bacterium]|nr:ABC transporter permease [Chloroflexota bacterium]
MSEAGGVAAVGTVGSRRHLLTTIGRQRELTLVAIMFVLGAGVSAIAPQFLSVSNFSQVAVLASIVAVAAVGEAIVVITRGIDLSVEAIIGLVAYSVARTLELQVLDPVGAIALGLGIGLLLGMVNGFIVAVLKVPAIVATLGTLSMFRGIDYVIAGPDQVPLAGLPVGFTDPARSDIFGIPIFVLITIGVVVVGSLVLRSTRFGRQVYAVGSNPEAAAILGIPSRLVVFVAFSVCGLLAGLAGVMWVMEFGTINGTAATGAVLGIVAAVVVGGVNIFGGSGTLAGAALGALFLGFIANALILVGLSQFWLQAIYGAVILVAVSTDALILRSVQRANTRTGAR